METIFIIMKKLIIILLYIISLSIFSQERINKKSLEFIKQSEKLDSVDGWYYNEYEGNWSKNLNECNPNKNSCSWERVDLSEWDSIKLMYKNEKYAWKYNPSKFCKISGIYNQNFKTLQFNLLIQNNIKYYILVIHKFDYGFEYPEIMEGGHTYNIEESYIFSEKEYIKLINIPKNIYIKLYSNKYPLFIYKNQDLIRFSIPSEKIINFKTQYFETTELNFKKLLIK